MRPGGKKSLKCSIPDYTLETWSELRAGKGIVACGYSSSANLMPPQSVQV